MLPGCLALSLQLLFMLGCRFPYRLSISSFTTRYLVGVVLNLWFFLTPIFYSITNVPSRYRIAAKSTHGSVH
jgi:ABC-type polysaccharide/polyol phosphate export permease